MRTVKYIRVSTADQNVDRQRERGVKEYIDKCSGSIPFSERVAAQKLIDDISVQKQKPNLPPNQRISTVKVSAISRLGRNLQDIINTVDLFTSWNICLISEKEGIKTLDNEGKENPTAKMVLSILATLSEYERELIKERQREGIAAAHKRGVYKNGGRPIETPQDFIAKPKNAKCMSLLSAGRSLREAAALSGVSLGTAQKVKKIGNDLGFLSKPYTFEPEMIEYSGGDADKFENVGGRLLPKGGEDFLKI